MQYNILMHTPLGKKHGTLTAVKTDNRLCGTFNILNHSRPFEGEVSSIGECKIHGSIVTLLRTAMYTATGIMDENRVHLYLKTDRNTFEVTGTAMRGEASA